MHDNLESIRRAADASIRRAKDMVASGAIERQMRPLQKMAGLIREMMPDEPNLVEAMGGEAAVRARVEEMMPFLRDLHPAPRTYPVTVEERKPAPSRPPRQQPGPYGPGKGAMQAFIRQQMIEAKDEAAQAACNRYILRNRLLG